MYYSAIAAGRRALWTRAVVVELAAGVGAVVLPRLAQLAFESYNGFPGPLECLIQGQAAVTSAY